MRFTDRIPTVRRLLLLTGVLVFAAACASGGGAAQSSTGSGAPLSAGGGAPAVAIRVTTMMQLGSFLTDAAGRTLYVFRKDGPDSSTCSGGCAAAWPALIAAPGASVAADPAIGARVGTFRRPDGRMQVTFDRAPLYYFGGDTAAGDTNGQGLAGNWFVAAISGARPAASAPAPTSASAGPAGSAPAPTSAGAYGGG